MSKSPYKIEKGVPMPRPRRKREYPWEQMEVGDSFLLSCKSEDAAKVANRARSAADSFAKKRGLSWRFSFRHVEGGIRIWRTK